MTVLAAQLQSVSKIYPHFALNNINLELTQGSIMGFIGPNGAGKSTTLRIMMGLVHQDSGQVNVLGYTMPIQQTLAKQNIGYVSEDMRLYNHATLNWHMQFIASIYPSWDHSYAKQLLRRFDLNPVHKIKGMSHGQRVKAALLLVFARRPKLLILDEPTTGLDPVARHEVLTALMEVLTDEERTILFSSHNTLDVEQISDQITFINLGHIIDCRDKESYLESWRRLRLEVPENKSLPDLPDAVNIKKAGKLCIVSCKNYNEMLLQKYQHAGAKLLSIENMSLEEIFINQVTSDKERNKS